MSRRPTTNRRLRHECFESRQMMAGNVTAALVQGSLMITGDDLGNGVNVEYLYVDDVWRLTGTNAAGGATTINGQNSIEFSASSVTGDFTINLKGGNDNLFFTTDLDSAGVSTPRDLTIHTGDGHDIVKLLKAGVGDDLVIDTGAGNDKVDFNLVFAGETGLDNGNNNLVIRTGIGSDLVDLFFSGASNNISIDTGFTGEPGKGDTDDDAVGLFGFSAGGHLTVKTGFGNDLVYMDSAGATFGVNVNTGDGNDEVFIDSSFAEDPRITGGDLNVELGMGDDTYTEGNFTVGGSKNIRDTNRPTEPEPSPLDRLFEILGREQDGERK